MEDNTNLFKHAPKELVTDAFLTWLFYFLDSDKKFNKYKNDFFAKLLLKQEDIGKEINNIDVIRQDSKGRGKTDIVLKFLLDKEPKSILFENKTWSTTTKKQLSMYKEDYEGCYKYIYLKLAYINYREEKLAKEFNYEIIDSLKIAKALNSLIKLHPFIDHYYQYINETFVKNIKVISYELYEKNNIEKLQNSQFQQYVISELYHELDYRNVEDLLFKTGSSFGRPWTELNICKKENVYGQADEYIFWRIDIRSNNYYIRLSQYAYINQEFSRMKLERRNELRHIIEEISKKYAFKPGKLSNRGIKECEILILFLDENKLVNLRNILPDFSMDFVQAYHKKL